MVYDPNPESPYNIYHVEPDPDLDLSEPLAQSPHSSEVPGFTAEHIRITLKNSHFEESGPFRSADGSFRVSAGFQVYLDTTTGRFTVRYEPGILALGRDPAYLLQIHDNWVTAYREVLDIAHFDTELALDNLTHQYPVIAILSYLRPLVELALIAPLQQRGQRSRAQKFTVYYPPGITRKERKFLYMQAYYEYKRSSKSSNSSTPSTDPNSPDYVNTTLTNTLSTRSRLRQAKELANSPDASTPETSSPFHIGDRCMLIHGHSRFRGSIGTLIYISPSGRQAVVKLDMGIDVNCRPSSLRILPTPADETPADETPQPD